VAAAGLNDSHSATGNTSPRSCYVDSDGLRLHHLDWGGKGRHAIVLVHGSRLHAHVWDDFSRRFRDRYHVIAVDQRGHGDSAWCAPAEYQLEALYRDLRSVVEARGLERCTLIGHSLGGRVSMLYASRHQSEIERLVLVDITPGRASAAGPQRGNGAPPRDFATEEAAVDYLARAMSRAPRRLVEMSVRHGLRRNEEGRHVWKYDPVLSKQRVALPPGVDLWNAMSTLAVPTLLQYGSESDVVNADLAERLRTTMPRCTIERIDGAGHGLFTDRPDAFSESVERFLAPAH
jgi:esterase